MLAGERCKEYRPGIIDLNRSKATTNGILKTILTVNFAIPLLRILSQSDQCQNIIFNKQRYKDQKLFSHALILKLTHFINYKEERFIQYNLS